MPLASPTIESSNYRAPGSCVICMQTRTESSGGFMVDTGIDMDTTFIDARTGRIYVCDMCTDELARLCDFVKEADIAKAKGDLEVAQGQLQVLRDDLRGAVQNLESVVDTVPDLEGS